MGGHYRAAGDEDAPWQLLTLFQLDQNQDKKSCLFPLAGVYTEKFSPNTLNRHKILNKSHPFFLLRAYTEKPSRRTPT
ncbi:MAG: hypothetical protein K2K19_13690, partial [Acetatifactor sp.]|nr:hypothetical protein [Acetatifactor sp.]